MRVRYLPVAEGRRLHSDFDWQIGFGSEDGAEDED